ncbi:hypothetical protein R3I94_001399 [Phoxinus phoxinus]
MIIDTYVINGNHKRRIETQALNQGFEETGCRRAAAQSLDFSANSGVLKINWSLTITFKQFLSNNPYIRGSCF